MSKAEKAPRGRAAKAAPRKTKTRPPKPESKKQTAAANEARKSAKEVRRELFVASYVRHHIGKQAAIDAGYSEATATVIASQILAEPETKALIRAFHASLSKTLNWTAQDAVDHWAQVAGADPRALSELHRGACRYCWGVGNRYQRTPREFEEHRADWERAEAAKQKMDPPGQPKAFDPEGGIGYTPKKDANPACPECFGDGEERVVLKDTRDLSPAELKLFAGVEKTKSGVKLRTHSQERAVANIARSLGAFNKKDEPPQGGDLAEAMRQARARAGIR